MNKQAIFKAIDCLQAFRLNAKVSEEISLFADTQLACAMIQIILDGMRNGVLNYDEARTLIYKVF